MSVKGNNPLTELEEPVMIDHNHRLQRQHVNNNNRLSEMTRKRKEMGKFITKGEFPTYLFHSTYGVVSLENWTRFCPPFQVNLINSVNLREAQLNPCRLASVHLSGALSGEIH